MFYGKSKTNLYALSALYTLSINGNTNFENKQSYRKYTTVNYANHLEPKRKGSIDYRDKWP